MRNCAVGSDLYQSTASFFESRGDAEWFVREWGGTPWMCWAYTYHKDRSAMLKWCRDRFGPSAWPSSGDAGKWRPCTGPIDGWMKFGFASEAMMLEFQAAWPDPEGELAR